MMVCTASKRERAARAHAPNTLDGSHRVIYTEKDVVRLDIAMHHAQGVNRMQPEQQLQGVSPYRLFRDGPARSLVLRQD